MKPFDIEFDTEITYDTKEKTFYDFGIYYLQKQ
jgi:hypothetical protein